MSSASFLVDRVQLLSRLLLSFWLGAFLAVGALVAPAIFDAAASSAQAGVVAGAVFDRLNIAGFGFAILILGLQRPFFGWMTGLLGFVMLLILLSQMWVTPQIELLREQSGGILVIGTSEYRAFWKWHGISNVIFFAEAIIVTIVLCLNFKENQN
ncbi:MAG: DUF4149 domain-containing protein [Proteobacteria bacterium]|jgi:hypothetical protein|nr:DUF4149 domain-containing protein [Pseudomonadota bacterium]